MKSYLRAAIAVYAKDIRLELRTKETFSAILIFAVIVAFIFGFAFDPSPSIIAVVGPGIVWVAYVFTGILGMNRTFAMERDRVFRRQGFDPRVGLRHHVLGTALDFHVLPIPPCRSLRRVARPRRV